MARLAVGRSSQALATTQTSVLREMLRTWDESSSGFLPVPERQPGPKGDPGERGAPGKEVRAGRSVGALGCVSAAASSLVSCRAPLAFLENVVRREIVETPALRGHLAWHLGRGAPLDLPVLPGSLENLEFLGSRARLGEWGKQEGQERG